MSIANEMGIPRKGRNGPWTYYMRNGQLIVRVADNARSRKGRTPRNMESRTKMSNVIHAWRSFNGDLNGMFEPQKAGQTDYNLFNSVNRTNARVCLTKDESRDGICVADNFCVAMGQLTPPVLVSEEEQWLVSDLRCGELEITAETSVSEVTHTLCGLNDGLLKEGDEVAFISLVQHLAFYSNPPSCTGEVVRIPLVKNFMKTLRELLPYGTPLDGFRNRGGFLAWKKQPNTLVAWARVRPVGKGHPLVTTQSLVGTPPLLAKYTSPEQIEEAINSYGPLE